MLSLSALRLSAAPSSPAALRWSTWFMTLTQLILLMLQMVTAGKGTLVLVDNWVLVTIG